MINLEEQLQKIEGNKQSLFYSIEVILQNLIENARLHVKNNLKYQEPHHRLYISQIYKLDKYGSISFYMDCKGTIYRYLLKKPSREILAEKIEPIELIKWCTSCDNIMKNNTRYIKTLDVYQHLKRYSKNLNNHNKK